MVRDLERVLHEALDGASKSSSSIPSSSFQPLDQTFAAKMLSYWSGTRAWYQVKFFWPSSSGWRALSSIRHRAESLITLETVYRRVALAPILRFIDKLPRQQMSGSALAIFFFSYWLFISSHIIRKSVGHGASLFLPRLSLLFSRAGHKDWRFHYLFIYLFIIYYFEDFIFQFVIGRCTRGTF